MSENNNNPVGKKEDISVTKLISEVKKRPALYDRSTEIEKKIKQRHWTDVCQNIVPHWDTLEIEEKQTKAKTIQSTWHELRRQFIAVHEQCLEEPKAKRTKWNYYDSLMFLVPYIWETEADTQAGKDSAQNNNATSLSDPKPKAQTETAATPKISIKLPYTIQLKAPGPTKELMPSKEIEPEVQLQVIGAMEPAPKTPSGELEPTAEMEPNEGLEPNEDVEPEGLETTGELESPGQLESVGLYPTADLGLSGDLGPTDELDPNGEPELPQIGPSELRVLDDTGLTNPELKPPEIAEIAEVPAVVTGTAPELTLYPLKDIEEDYHFLMSLLPSFRRFNDEQRFLARMEMLRLMRHISLMGYDKVSAYNSDLMKYSYGEPCEVPNPNVLDPVPAPMAALNEEAYPGMKRDETGEIQYPETDTEDYDG